MLFAVTTVPEVIFVELLRLGKGRDEVLDLSFGLAARTIDLYFDIVRPCLLGVLDFGVGLVILSEHQQNFEGLAIRVKLFRPFYKLSDGLLALRRQFIPIYCDLEELVTLLSAQEVFLVDFFVVYFWYRVQHSIELPLGLANSFLIVIVEMSEFFEHAEV